MAAFTGTCLVRRAEILQLQGIWVDAMAEADRACKPIAHGGADRGRPAAAFYQKAEMHRLRGEVEAAEEGYRTASRLGREPQPGLALLRMHQGRADAASAAIRRAVGAVADPWSARGSCPRISRSMLATGDLEEARRACRDLEGIAQELPTEILQAMQPRRGAPWRWRKGTPGLPSLSCVARSWRGKRRSTLRGGTRAGAHGVGVPLDWRRGDGRARARRGQSCLRALGAEPEIARLDALGKHNGRSRSRTDPARASILRLIAAGKTNKAMAAELFLSERTIDRHVSNIFCKARRPSRAAATAYAYERKILS